MSDISKIIKLPIPDGASLDLAIDGVSALDDATAGQVSFLDNPKYVSTVSQCEASVILCRKRYADKIPDGAIAWVSMDPYRAYAQIAAALYPEALDFPPVLDTASRGNLEGYVAPTASLENGVTVEHNASIGAGAEIGSGTIISSGAVIGRHVTIGRGCFIGPNVVLQHCCIGDDVILHSGVCIGQDGFGFAMGPLGHLKVPQLGRVIIQDNVEMGAGTCVDRGTNRDTVIGEGTKIDNQVQIGHNVQIGRNCVIVAQVALAGSCTLGDFVVIGGQTGVIGHVTVGDGAQIAGVSAVHGDVPAGARWGGVPAKPLREWFKEATLLSQLAKKKVTAVVSTDEN